MTGVGTIAMAMVALSVVLTTVRLLRGPSVADRVVAADLLLTFFVIGIAVLAATTGKVEFFEAMLVVAVLAFLGTAMVARYIERRGA